MAASGHREDAAVMAGARRGVGLVRSALFPARKADEPTEERDEPDIAARWSKRRLTK